MADGDQVTGRESTSEPSLGPDCHVYEASATYDVRCSCGFEALDFSDLASAGEVMRLHLGDDHCENCGSVNIDAGGVCVDCFYVEVLRGG